MESETEKAELTGLVFDIKRFAIHDGPGIRTTVFLKGCPLHCAWCHNPESIRHNPEISFIPDKCLGCGYCVEVCPQKAHKIVDGKHLYDRALCRQCGLCTEKCYAQALEVAGKTMSVSEVIGEVMKDKPFYDTSGGGMTLSGGEPMSQFKFTKALLQAGKDNGLHNCLDTSGLAPYKQFGEILDLVDLFHYDYKETDPEIHKKFTGVDNKLILENLKKLDRAGKKSILRCPIIPGCNDRPDHLKAIADLANSLDNVLEINIQPYHPLGKDKHQRFGSDQSFGSDSFADAEQIEEWIKTVQANTKVEVKKG